MPPGGRRFLSLARRHLCFRGSMIHRFLLRTSEINRGQGLRRFGTLAFLCCLAATIANPAAAQQAAADQQTKETRPVPPPARNAQPQSNELDIAIGGSTLWSFKNTT